MKAWRDLKNLPRELWILCLATLVNRLGTMVLPFLVLYLTRSLGFSGAQAAAAFAVYGAVALVVGPIAGRFSDRWGAARMLPMSLAASGVALLMFPLARSWGAVLLMTILFAATNEAFRPANLALVSELSPPEHRKSAFALSRLAINLGMSVGPALGGFLAQSSFTLLFVIDGLTALAAAAILMFSSFYPLVKSREVKVTPSSAGRTWRPNILFEDSRLRFFLLGIVPVLMVFWQHESSMPLFLVRNLNFSESVYGLLFTLNTVMIIAIEIPLNSATSSWPHGRTLAVGSFLFAAGFGALSVARSHVEVAATVVIWTFGEMILLPGMSAYVSEIAPKGRQGEYMGLYMMSFSFALIVGSWLGILALERYGSTTFWLATFAVGMVSVVVLGLPKQAAKANEN